MCVCVCPEVPSSLTVAKRHLWLPGNWEEALAFLAQASGCGDTGNGCEGNGKPPMNRGFKRKIIYTWSICNCHV